MDVLDAVALVVFLFIMHAIFIKPFLLTFRKFRCLRCGHCCRLKVKLSKEDIKRLKDAGKKDFVENGKWLKRINGYCMFLEIKNGTAKCTAYNARPEICRWWPIRKFACDTRCRFYNKKK